MMLMYTSGTTGLPKAARITNRRFTMMSLGFAHTIGGAAAGRRHLLRAAAVARDRRDRRPRRRRRRRHDARAPRRLLDVGVLDRLRARGRHRRSLHRRGLPLPRAGAREPGRAPSPRAAVLRRRAAARRVDRLPAPLPRARDRRVLRLDRGQRGAGQRRGRAGHDRTPQLRPGRGAGRPRDHRADPRRARPRHAGGGGRARHADRPHQRSHPLRRLHRSGGDREEDPARRLR